MSGLTLTMFREGDGPNVRLVPTAETFIVDMERIPKKIEVVVTVRRARSAKHLRTFFGKLRAAIDFGVWDADTESLLAYIKIGIGHCTTVIDATSTLVSDRLRNLAQRVLDRHGAGSEEGRLARALIDLSGPRSWLVPKSIALESMDQDAFNDFDRRSDRFLAERLGVDPDALFRHMVDKAQLRLPAEEAEEGETLDERLRSIAFELGFAADLGEMEKTWEAAKQRPDVRELHEKAPTILKELVVTARGKARGDFDAATFDRIVREVSGRAS